MTEALFGVVAETLDEANAQLEQQLGIRTIGGEGLHNGGEYQHLRQAEYSLQLRENIDLDDTEMEHNGLHEPDFPEFKWLLYIWGASDSTKALASLAQRPEVFVRLR